MKPKLGMICATEFSEAQLNVHSIFILLYRLHNQRNSVIRVDGADSLVMDLLNYLILNMMERSWEVEEGASLNTAKRIFLSHVVVSVPGIPLKSCALSL